MASCWINPMENHLDVFDLDKFMAGIPVEQMPIRKKKKPTPKKEEKILYKNKFWNAFSVKRVHCSGDVTVVIWADNTKTMVRCQNGEKFDPEKGIAMCFMKKAFGGKSVFNDAMKVMLDTAFDK